eukprot:6174306-Pleurochrysis_carterae.AAC.1
MLSFPDVPLLATPGRAVRFGQRRVHRAARPLHVPPRRLPRRYYLLSRCKKFKEQQARFYAGEVPQPSGPAALVPHRPRISPCSGSAARVPNGSRASAGASA